MEQLSVPYRIALVGLLVMAGLWFTLLKPGGTTSEGDPAAVTETTVAAADAAGARREAAAGAEGVAKRSAAVRDPSARLLRALDAGQVVVLAFYNRRASDDRAVRDAVAAVGRREGKVRTEVASIGAVGRYEAITRGARVLETPTVLVIGPDRSARAIVGFTTTPELDQAVGDALRTRRR